MVNLLDLLLQSGNVFFIHVFDNTEGKRACSELIDQDVLPLHGVDLLRQVGQNIIIDPGPDVADDRRNQQNERDNQDRYSELNDSFTDFLHKTPSFQK